MNMEMKVWKTELSRIHNLANPVWDLGGDGAKIELEDLDTNQKYTIIFKNYLGFRYEIDFNTKLFANTFIVKNSEWINEMKKKPLNTQKMDKAIHYLISTICGQIEFISLDEPIIEKKNSF